MRKKIFITRKISDEIALILRKKGYLVNGNTEDKILSQKEIIAHIKKDSYDAVITLLTDKIDSTVFENAPTVKLFANFASGFDNIDINEARKRGITVTNAPSKESADAVAEHTIALIVSLARRVVEADTYTKKGKYTGWSPTLFTGSALSGKTIGLIGVGRIGTIVAEYAAKLGFKIIYTDVVKNKAVDNLGGIYFSTKEQVMKKSDFISIHTPLLKSTYHLINKKNISLIKKTAFLINTARGPIIDEDALTTALEKKKIAGAALDVFEYEPKISKRLRKLNNVILTPHIASATNEARKKMTETVIQNIEDYFKGKKPKNTIN